MDSRCIDEIHSALRAMGMPANTTFQDVAEVRDVVELYVGDKLGVDFLDLLSLPDLFQIATPTTGIKLSREALKYIETQMDGGAVREQTICPLIDVKSDPTVMRHAKNIESRLRSLSLHLRFRYNPHSISIYYRAQLFARYEVKELRRYRYLFGTIVISNINNQQQAKEQFPKFVWDNEYIIGMRSAKRQCCIRNVTEGVFVRFVREYMIKNEWTD